jgi:hypothetical protein
LNRRQPTKDDYMNFVLYQANQKAYEATLLKNFFVHALHPERIAECFDIESRSSEEAAAYFQSVLRNAKGMADKMIWNAHSRAVNLLANDGKDGAPFLDVQQLGQRMFSDFCPDNLVSVVGRVNESWHRAFSEPAMVRMSTKQYPIGSNSSPFEEIDDIADRVFNDKAFTSLPTGRATKPMNRRSVKGRGLPGATLREEPQDRSRRNWLTFAPQELPKRTPTPPSTSFGHRDNLTAVQAASGSEEPRIIQDLRDMQYTDHASHEQLQSSNGDRVGAGLHATQLEYLYDRFGEQALDSNRVDGLAPTGNNEPFNIPGDSGDDDLFDDPDSVLGEDMLVKVPLWRAKLVSDHKRRLTERWGNPPQTLQRVLPGIKHVIAEAFAKGYRPTTDDYHDKIRIIEEREKRNMAIPRLAHPTFSDYKNPNHHISAPISSEASSLQHAELFTTKKHKQCVSAPNKRRKTNQASSGTTKTNNSVKKHPKGSVVEKKTAKPRVQQSIITSPSEPHSIGSITLETDQSLPPGAYFEAQSPDEKPAWLCGIKHAMGYYYNSGARKSCMGCFTHIKDCAKNKHMDFYLPDSTYFFQPATDIIWTPSKDLGKQRRSKNMSHNTIAKIAFWNSIRAGSTANDARKAGVDAIEVSLLPKPRKEPTPEPTPKPSPQPGPDFGPHPSGSVTMEHGQEIPECAYFDEERQEESAWRCDVNHALGRYYLAGDKRTCPGCGSNRHGAGKQKDMDFYMPFGVVVRQEAPELSKWAPRKPNKRKEGASKSTVVKHLTHNQACSKKYFEAVEAGAEHAEAVKIAIEVLEAELEDKQAKALKAQEELQDEPRASTKSAKAKRGAVKPTRSSNAKNEALDGDGDEDDEDDEDGHTSSGYSTISLVPRKRAFDEDSDDEMDDDSIPQGSATDVEQSVVEYSSSDDETSGSDSE